MAKLYNLARMTTATTGTGTITLGSAVVSYLSFASAGVSNGETVTYAIVDGNNREIGRGVYTASGTTLTRTVLKSTNSDTAINLSGSAEVFITAASEDIANKGETNTFSALQTFTGGASITNLTLTGTPVEDVFAITDGAAFEVDPANGSIQTITLGASRTPKATNFQAGQGVTLMVDDGTAYTITWTDSTWGTGGVKWAGGSAPTLATTGYTVIEFWKVGTQVYGALVGSA